MEDLRKKSKRTALGGSGYEYPALNRRLLRSFEAPWRTVGTSAETD